MFQVLITSKLFEKPFPFFVSKSLEDCVQVALNLHRACNTEHRISVFDEDSSQTRLSLFSENFE